MYKFHYDYMKHKYERKKSHLLFKDTDSLVYSIKTKNRRIYRKRIYIEREDIYDICRRIKANLILVDTWKIKIKSEK